MALRLVLLMVLSIILIKLGKWLEEIDDDGYIFAENKKEVHGKFLLSAIAIVIMVALTIGV